MADVSFLRFFCMSCMPSFLLRVEKPAGGIRYLRLFCIIFELSQSAFKDVVALITMRIICPSYRSNEFVNELIYRLQGGSDRADTMVITPIRVDG